MHDSSLYVLWIRRTALCLIVFCMLLELITRLGFLRISHIESRISEEQRAAVNMRRTPGRTKFLLLGNSLPLHAVDVAQLNSELSPRATCTRFVIEATEYLDWYYGLRRLFADGSNPDVVLLSIDATHLNSMRTRGDYSAFYLFQTRDLPIISKAAHYDLTKTAGLVLARYSLFYAGRTGLRNFVLNHVDDPYAEMVRNLPAPENQPTVKKELGSLEFQRLRALRDLCESHRVRFILLIPPGFGDDEKVLRLEAGRAGTEVLIPIPQNQLGKDQFKDGYHLNESGARTFTTKLGQDLNSYLDRTLTY